MKCPKCSKSQIYHQKKPNTMRCVKCGYEGKKEEFFINKNGERLLS